MMKRQKKYSFVPSTDGSTDFKYLNTNYEIWICASGGAGGGGQIVIASFRHGEMLLHQLNLSAGNFVSISGDVYLRLSSRSVVETMYGIPIIQRRRGEGGWGGNGIVCIPELWLHHLFHLKVLQEFGKVNASFRALPFRARNDASYSCKGRSKGWKHGNKPSHDVHSPLESFSFWHVPLASSYEGKLKSNWSMVKKKFKSYFVTKCTSMLSFTICASLHSCAIAHSHVILDKLHCGTFGIQERNR